MRFKNADEVKAGGLLLNLTSPPQYRLGMCNTSWTNFPAVLPSETIKVWKIALSKLSGKIRVVVDCNNKEVLSVVVSSNTCSESYSTWSKVWNRNVEKIHFPSGSAPDYYGPGELLMSLSYLSI